MTSTVTRRALFAFIALLLVVPAASGQTNSTEAAVRALETRRTDAMVKNDTATLQTLLADDLTYFHSSGLVDTKNSFIALLKSGDLKYRSITTSDVKVRVFGDAAIVTGQAVMISKRVNADEATNKLLFTAIWAQSGGTWRFVAWQSTKLP
jgi:ketosteroid isomerase-like protein